MILHITVQLDSSDVGELQREISSGPGAPGEGS